MTFADAAKSNPVYCFKKQLSEQEMGFLFFSIDVFCSNLQYFVAEIIECYLCFGDTFLSNSSCFAQLKNCLN